jgi:hypothetical protein
VRHKEAWGHGAACSTRSSSSGAAVSKAVRVFGSTEDFGFKAHENVLEVHDLHATILHLMGFDHEKLTYRCAGRDFRLTDVHGHVVKDVVA